MEDEEAEGVVVAAVEEAVGEEEEVESVVSEEAEEGVVEDEGAIVMEVVGAAEEVAEKVAKVTGNVRIQIVATPTLPGEMLAIGLYILSQFFFLYSHQRCKIIHIIFILYFLTNGIYYQSIKTRILVIVDQLRT